MLRELLDARRYFKLSKKSPITFYSESGIYYQNYRATIEEILKRSDYKVLYLTSDLKDPVFNLNNERIVPFYIKQLVPFVFPFISTKVFVLTMPDLNRFHVKRSTNKVNHVYLFHAINSTHMTYNHGAFDFYDTIFCVGPHHNAEIRKTEELYSLPKKELINAGYPLLEELASKFKKRDPDKTVARKKKILIAPSWNTSNILDTCIEPILKTLSGNDFDIVVRPHPEYIKRFPQAIDSLQKEIAAYSDVTLELQMTSDASVRDADLLITDWSGISFEFSWSMGKPVIFINTPRKVHNPAYEKLGLPPLEVRVREETGTVVEPDKINNSLLALVRSKLAAGAGERERLFALRAQHIYNWGRSAEVSADYIVNFCKTNET